MSKKFPESKVKLLKQGVSDLITNITNLSNTYTRLDKNSIQIAYDTLIHLLETNPPPTLNLSTIPTAPVITRDIIEKEVSRQIALEREESKNKRKSDIDKSACETKRRILNSIRNSSDAGNFISDSNQCGKKNNVFVISSLDDI